MALNCQPLFAVHLIHNQQDEGMRGMSILMLLALLILLGRKMVYLVGLTTWWKQEQLVMGVTLLSIPVLSHYAMALNFLPQPLDEGMREI